MSAEEYILSVSGRGATHACRLSEATLGNTDALPPQDLAASPGTQSCRFALDDLSVAQNVIRLLSFLLSLAVFSPLYPVGLDVKQGRAEGGVEGNHK